MFFFHFYYIIYTEPMGAPYNPLAATLLIAGMDLGVFSLMF